MTGITDEMVKRALRAIDDLAEDDGSISASLLFPAMKKALTAAFPNLANGTTWEAPMEATDEMVTASWLMDFEDGVAPHAVFVAMRDSYLAIRKGE